MGVTGNHCAKCGFEPQPVAVGVWEEEELNHDSECYVGKLPNGSPFVCLAETKNRMGMC